MAADASGWLCALFTLAAAGRWEAVARECRAGQDDMRRRGSEFDYVFATNLLSEALHEQGRLIDAEAEARNALEIGTRAGVGSWLWLDGARRLGWILLDRGLDREASELVKTARLDEIEFDEPSAHLRLIRGWLAARAGDLVAARDEFLAVGEGVVADGVTNPALCAWRSAAALVLARLDEPERARAIAEEELKLARSVAMPGPLGRALWSTGVVVRGEAGLALLREAVATLDGSEAVLELARARLALGGELRRAGHRRAARDELRAALEVAERSSAEALAEIAREELHVSGARMRREALTGLGSLTPSERRVAQLAAEGSSNPEIAQALFVTRKTVETHLGRVYMKLDLRSRDELAARVRRGAHRSQLNDVASRSLSAFSSTSADRNQTARDQYSGTTGARPVTSRSTSAHARALAVGSASSLARSIARFTAGSLSCETLAFSLGWMVRPSNTGASADAPSSKSVSQLIVGHTAASSWGRPQ